MVNITAEQGGVYVRNVYIATPLGQPLMDGLSKLTIAKDLVPWQVPDIEAYTGYPIMGNELVHFTASRLNTPVTNSDTYDRPAVWPSNHSSLNIAAVGKREYVDQLVDETLGLFPTIDLHLDNRFAAEFQDVTASLIDAYQGENSFFQTYQRLCSRIDDYKEIPSKGLSVLTDMVMHMFPTFYGHGPLAPENKMLLVHPIEFKVGTKPALAGLIYIGGPGLCKIIGIALQVNYGATDTRVSAEPRSLAASVLLPDILFLMGSRPRINKVTGADEPSLTSPELTLESVDFMVKVDQYSRRQAVNHFANYPGVNKEEIATLGQLLADAAK